VTARALLSGHESDLAALVHLFPAGDPCVVRADEGTFLQATELDYPFAANDGHRLMEVADGILRPLNGIALLRSGGYRPVRLGNHFVRGDAQHVTVADDAPARDSISVVTAGARLAGTTTMTLGGASATPPSDGPRQLARAAANSDAQDLLMLVGGAETLGWDTLWKAMEIVRAAVGGKQGLFANGWISSNEFDDFGYAANEPLASGDDARHARRPPRNPPANIMTLEQGQELIRRLARNWLNSLP
jgi:hypothetical protein